MGHKWMWNPKWGGLPPEEFLVAVDPLLEGVREKLGGEYLTSDTIAGHLSRGVGGEAGTARGDSDSGGRVRRALGCDWLAYPRRRRGECGRHVDLHYRDGAGDANWCRAFAAWCRAACIRRTRGLRRGFRRRAISLRRLHSGRGRECAELSKGLEAYRPGRRGCCD